MRSFLVLLLCLLLPLQGLALAPASEPPCPMTQATAADDPHAAAPDCCEDDDGGTDERRCKPGQECPGGSYTLPMRASPPWFAQPGAGNAVAAIEGRDLFCPDGVWRPPTRG
ncbi:MAG TPA: hypothetical protein VFY12_04480 [Arenimonas sp.]|nr:hypothetical protein [Arenimonas sp.]